MLSSTGSGYGIRNRKQQRVNIYYESQMDQIVISRERTIGALIAETVIWILYYGRNICNFSMANNIFQQWAYRLTSRYECAMFQTIFVHPYRLCCGESHPVKLSSCVMNSSRY
jgi:hypothetical protein